MVSIGSQTNFTNLSSIRISNSKSFLKQPSSSLTNYSNNNSNFSKQSVIRPKTQHRSCRISAVAAGAAVESEPVYVNTQSSTLYELLGISESGTLSEIKNAYRQLARKYHPDVSPPDRTDEYTQRFLQVQEAYETLSDPQTRASYDRDMARALFNGRKRGDRVHVGFVDRDEWQSQLEDLIRSSNINDDEDSQSWGAKMRSKNRSV